MANVLIVATGSVYTGTSDGDSIQFLSGALPGSQILGEGGADTINLNQGFVGTTSDGYLVAGGAGNDSIFVTSGTFKNSAGPTLQGGAGNDTITISGGTVQALQAQDGNDVISANNGNIFQTFAAGKNADDVTFSGTISSSLGLGRGHDKISGGIATFGSSASLNLGEGRDTITLGIASNGSAQTILGDAGNGVNAGADVIDLELGAPAGVITGLSFNAGGGADTVNLSGAFQSANLAGGKGADVITLNATTLSQSTLGAGAGNDTISLAADFATTGIVKGGEGNDSIFLGGLAAASDIGTIQGGAGADSITLSGGAADGDDLNVLYFSALSESNLATTDVLTVSGATNAVVSGTFDFNNSAKVAVAVGDASAGVLFGSTINKATLAGGFVTFSGTFATDAVSSVTAAMATVDTLTLAGGVGGAAIFTANGDQFLFMQGGTAGTSDDGLVNLGSSMSASVLGADAAGTAALVTFSGQLS